MTLDAETIASYCISDSNNPKIQLGQTEHRINLVLKWGIDEGDHVLELGCGQGDCTAVLATAVGAKGTVTAVDPAPPTYGAPFNLKQAHAHLKASEVGDRITFYESDTLDFLASTDAVYDVAVLAHCIWYFANPSTVIDTLKALSTRAKRICVAEYTLTPSSIDTVPHVLAALAHASLECRKPQTEANIRTLLSPTRILEKATSAGLSIVDQGTLKAPATMYDGKWEVTDVLGKNFEQELFENVKNERERAVVEALIDATRFSRDMVGKATTMDVWYAVLTKDG